MAVFRWRHFAGEIILWAVRWYCRYGISYRELEEMMGERGVAVDHTTVYRWTQRYAADCGRPHAGAPPPRPRARQLRRPAEPSPRSTRIDADQPW